MVLGSTSVGTHSDFVHFDLENGAKFEIVAINARVSRVYLSLGLMSVYRDLQQDVSWSVYRDLQQDVSRNPSSISMSRDWISSSWDTVAYSQSVMLISCWLLVGQSMSERE